MWPVVITTLSLDATILISKNCPIIGEHVFIMFVTQKVTIATVWTAKNAFTTALGACNSKMARDSEPLQIFKTFTNMNERCSPMIGQFFDTMIVASRVGIMTHQNIITGNCFEPPWETPKCTSRPLLRQASSQIPLQYSKCPRIHSVNSIQLCYASLQSSHY